jgi:hypothetical protein
MGLRKIPVTNLDNSTMISETTFSENYTSTWRMLAPAMDIFVRKMNLELYEREYPILNSSVSPTRRGFVNEIAFNVFCHSQEQDVQHSWTQDVLARAIHEAQNKLSRLKQPTPETQPPDGIELLDCAEQLRRFRSFFLRSARSAELKIHPRYPGAGIIDSCEGDIQFDRTLFEVKAGHRTFRSVDIKQLLTYSALNNAAGLQPLERVGLFNPRMGISFTSTLDSICLEVSGCPAAELLHEIIRVVSGGDISR